MFKTLNLIKKNVYFNAIIDKCCWWFRSRPRSPVIKSVPAASQHLLFDRLLIRNPSDSVFYCRTWSSVVDPGSHWIRIQEIYGSGSVFRIRFRILLYFLWYIFPPQISLNFQNCWHIPGSWSKLGQNYGSGYKFSVFGSTTLPGSFKPELNTVPIKSVEHK